MTLVVHLITCPTCKTEAAAYNAKVGLLLGCATCGQQMRVTKLS